MIKAAVDATITNTHVVSVVASAVALLLITFMVYVLLMTTFLLFISVVMKFPELFYFLVDK